MQQLNSILASNWFRFSILALIIVNAVIMGVLTMPDIAPETRTLLTNIDTVILYIFVIEIALKLIAQRFQFFTNGWNIFDFMIVGASVLHFWPAAAALRCLRVFRVLRLLSFAPKMREVVASLWLSIPGVSSVIGLLLIIYYVFALLFIDLFGTEFPEIFGSLPNALFSLFQLMTVEGWYEGVAEPIAAIYPWALPVFIAFVCMTSFIFLNVVIAVMINAMEQAQTEMILDNQRGQRKNDEKIMTLLADLRTEVQSLKTERIKSTSIKKKK